MKRRAFLPSLLLPVVLWASSAVAGDGIVYVDIQELFKRFYKTKLAQNQLRIQNDDVERERTIMEKDIKRLKEEIETLRSDARDETLSEEVREGKRSQLEEKLVDLQMKEREMGEFTTLRNKQIEQQKKRKINKILDEIHETVIRYAKEEGYSAVIDRSAKSRNGTEMVLFSDPKLDITPEVLLVLNKGREGALGETGEGR